MSEMAAVIDNKWYPIPGRSKYYVSKEGCILSTKMNRMTELATHIHSSTKRRRVNLTERGECVCQFVDNAVWTAFNGEIPVGMYVAHKNGDRSDDRLDNLILITEEQYQNSMKEEIRNMITQRMKSAIKIDPYALEKGKFLALSALTSVYSYKAEQLNFEQVGTNAFAWESNLQYWVAIIDDDGNGADVRSILKTSGTEFFHRRIKREEDRTRIKAVWE